MGKIGTVALLGLMVIALAGAGCPRRIEGDFKSPCRFALDVLFVDNDRASNKECRKSRPVLTDSLQLIGPDDVSRGCFNEGDDRRGQVVIQKHNVVEEIEHALEVFCTDNVLH